MAVRAWHKDRSATLNAVEQLRGSACPNAYARTWQPDQPDRGPAGWWPRSQGKQTNRSSVRLVWELASFTDPNLAETAATLQTVGDPP